MKLCDRGSGDSVLPIKAAVSVIQCIGRVVSVVVVFL